MHLAAKFGDHRSYRNEISILISVLTWVPWKKLNSPPRSTILGEQKEEHRQLQSVSRKCKNNLKSINVRQSSGTGTVLINRPEQKKK